MIYLNVWILQCDPTLIQNWSSYEETYPCHGGIQFQHLYYTPKDEDDGKQLSCALDEDYDNTAEYITAPVNLRVIQKTMRNNFQRSVDVEELQAEFKDAWGETHVHVGKNKI